LPAGIDPLEGWIISAEPFPQASGPKRPPRGRPGNRD
jgi:hypothetical protein